MIVIRTNRQFTSLMRDISHRINKGLDKAALKIAEEVEKEAKNIIKTKSKKYTGRLAGAISVEPGSANTNGYYRYDVIVDAKAVPYAIWIEFGRSAPEGLPYSKKGTKDYSKSSFPGQSYMRGAMDKYKDISNSGEIIGKEIYKSMKKLRVK